ncbi:MAG: GHKL domain-containing protein [bacterium]|nr:GHKL domain-containing protein [bacterium]
MTLGRSIFGTGRDMKSWPVLLLLLVVVLVPTVGVLWFMGQAMRNERLAVRQKLSDVYQAQLLDLRQDLQQFWDRRSAELDVRESESAAAAFARGVRDDLADGVIVLGETGRPAYPAGAAPLQDDLVLPGSWRRAERSEWRGEHETAAELYASIATTSGEPRLAARALQAQARCLVQAQAADEAIEVLGYLLRDSRFEDASDSQGRRIAPSAGLRALQLIGEPEDPRFRDVAAVLHARLSIYAGPMLPAAQRRFLMGQIAELDPDGTPFDTLGAERLAQRYLDSDPPGPTASALRPAGLPGVWHLASRDGRVVALFEQPQLIRDLESWIAERRPEDGAQLELLPPGVDSEDVFLVALPAGGYLPEWKIVLRPDDQELFSTAASQQITAYLLTGVLVVLLILVLALLVARALQRQLRLTRLKNDLLATVSHELKTPLASTRLLVDTLLETGTDDSQRVREYLQLIAKENLRLSRLVENFLTFSRMEQNRHNFERREVAAASVIEAAAASVAERFRSAGCRFEVEAAPDLPTVAADHDALVTVLINLLDNAYKYSGDDRHIVLRGRRENGDVCFSVSDNGIGLSSRAANRIFDRFYQVDQSLSRGGSGVGLGLSIVQFIVRAHEGTVEVDSRPGTGSTFTVRLPVAREVAAVEGV